MQKRRNRSRSRRGSGADRGRYSAQRKLEAVVRLLKGEDLDTLSRELGVTAARLSEWRDAALNGASGALKSRAPDSEAAEEIARLKSLVGDLTMRLEIHREALAEIKEGRDPFGSRRSR